MDTPASPQESVRNAWSPPLPEAADFEHAMIETPGLRTHVATIGQGDPVVMLHGSPSTGGSGASSRRRSQPTGTG